MLSRLLPAEVAVAEVFDDPEDAVLFPGEEAAIARAVPTRRREYITTRHCARIALSRLGMAPAAIGSGRNGEPLWPADVVGSMTHCAGYRAAAVARSGTVAGAGMVTGTGTVTGIGIDAEPHAPLPDGVLDTIARADELPALRELAARHPRTHWDRLLFSAKESVYKTWFPVAERRLGFDEATLEFVPEERVFTARIHQDGAPVRRMSGRWLVESGLIVTAITL